MDKSLVVFSLVICVSVLMFLFPLTFHGGLLMVTAETKGPIDGSQTWDYVQVRPGAHMFWWYYKSPNRTQDSNKPWPIILWLQGGPGASGVGIGNFQEIGPLDTNSKPRDSTWLQIADLLFVDSPVGTGYSYVENESYLVKSDEEAADDLTTLLIKLFNENVNLQKSPLYIVGESYGGKHAVALALAALTAIHNNKLKLNLGGVVLGNSWISPEDYTFSWGPLLNDISRLDNNCLDQSNILANQIKQKLDDGDSLTAKLHFDELANFTSENSNGVNFYNFLFDDWIDPLTSSSESSSSLSSQLETSRMKRYSEYLSSLRSSPRKVYDNLTILMNGEIKKMLNIIPQDLKWESYSELVSNASAVDFMKPRIQEVAQLLSEGVDVTIYNGQLDVICSTKGTEAWVDKLNWDGKARFCKMKRRPIYYIDDVTRGFTKSYKNFHFYWILGAGHYVPVERPFVTLSMIANITQSPAA